MLDAELTVEPGGESAPRLHPHFVPIESLRGAHIAIATPCYGNAFSQQYLVSMLKTQSFFHKIDFPLTTLLGTGASVERVRNQLVCQFLADKELTHLLFIDSDEGWEPESVIRLLATGHDVVGVPVHKKVDGDAAWNINPLGSDELIVENGCFEVIGIGTGFLMISRAALLRMIEVYPELKIRDDDFPDSENLYALFARTLVNTRDISEDFSFCLRWRKIGGRVWAEPDGQIVHVGQREWTGRVSDCFTKVSPLLGDGEGSGLFTLPSRGRPNDLARFIGAYQATNAVSRVVVRLDEDDPALDAYRKLAYPSNWVVYEGPRLETRCVGSVAEIFEKWPNERFYGLLSDDLLPRTQEWDTKLANAAGSGFLAFGDDKMRGEALATHPVIGGDLVRAIGWIVLQGVKHSFVDRVLHEIAHGCGRVRYLGEVVTEHLHPLAGKAEIDGTHRYEETYDEDKAVYEKWRELEFSGVVARVVEKLGAAG